MPDRAVPDFVDARKIFIQQGEVEGTLRPDHLPRLRELLSNGSGEITARLTFCVDEQGHKTMTGRVDANLEVPCQRCLDPVGIVLGDDIKLVLVPDSDAAKTPPEGYEAWISAETMIDVKALLEEQLILDMPIVAYHETGPCLERQHYSVPARPDSKEREEKDDHSGPFAILASLKRK